MGNEHSVASATGVRVRFIEVDDTRAGQRLDNFLKLHLKGVPKTRIYRIIRKGEVRVNKGRVTAGYRLEAGDNVRIPPVRMAEKVPAPLPGAGMSGAIEKSIVYEDDALLVVNKPAGMAVHGGSGVSLGIIEALRAMRPAGRFLELVHRLDRDTSGCLLIARKRSMLKHLHVQMQSGKTEKIYRLLVVGRWPERRRKVKAPLLKNTLRSGERIVVVHPEGKSAVTHFRILERLDGYTLLEARLETGRTHQIRVHARYVGCPVAGDEKYGDDEVNKAMRQQGICRLFLHAFCLKVQLPDRREMVFETPLPKDLREGLQQLRG